MGKTSKVLSKSLDGEKFHGMFAQSAAFLESQVETINALNVFPVPDGDTGTNMLLTIRSALDASKSRSSVSQVALDLARGSLMGARGNSGVILSQIFKGLSESISDAPLLTGSSLISGFDAAAKAALNVVPDPVEGTMLTVINEVAIATSNSNMGSDPALIQVLEVGVKAAEEAVARTPFQLSVLRENGVVDAGGEGLATILRGALAYMKGEPLEHVIPTESLISSETQSYKVTAEVYGYCAEFLIDGSGNVNVNEVRTQMLTLGNSVLVASMDHVIKVHLHTDEPAIVKNQLATFGNILESKFDDIDEQHREFLGKKSALRKQIGVVVLAMGEGFVNLYNSLGAAAVVLGGQTMNPSPREILSAVEKIDGSEAIVLTNNVNVVAAARQVSKLAPRMDIRVVETADMAQGVAAMVAFNYENGMEDNINAMVRAKEEIKTGEVTVAVKDAIIDGNEIKQGQAIGLVNGKLIIVANDISEATLGLAEQLEVDSDCLISLYYGEAMDLMDVERLFKEFCRRYPESEITKINGGQLSCEIILGVE